MCSGVNEAKYATTGTAKEFWSVWKEVCRTKEEEEKYANVLKEIKNAALPNTDRVAIFNQRYKNDCSILLN